MSIHVGEQLSETQEQICFDLAESLRGKIIESHSKGRATIINDRAIFFDFNAEPSTFSHSYSLLFPFGPHISNGRDTAWVARLISFGYGFNASPILLETADINLYLDVDFESRDTKYAIKPDQEEIIDLTSAASKLREYTLGESPICTEIEIAELIKSFGVPNADELTIIRILLEGGLAALRD